MNVSPSPKRRWRGRLISLAVVAVVLVVGGPYVYIHYIEGNPPPALALSNGTATTVVAASASTTLAGTSSTLAGTTPAATGVASAASTPSVDGSWTVSTGSEVGYRVGEVLLGQSTTAVGRTTAITGSLTISGTSVNAASFTAEMTKVSSDRSQRDGQFQGRIMDTSQYPTGIFTLTKPIALGTLPADGTVVSEQATGTLTLHGTTKTVSFALSAKRSGTTIQASGQIPIAFADFSIPNPSIGGFVTTQDHGILEFLLDFSH